MTKVVAMGAYFGLAWSVSSTLARSGRAHTARMTRFGPSARGLTVGDGRPDVLLDEIRVECDRCCGAFACGGDDLRARVGDVPGDPHTANGRLPARVLDRPAVGLEVAAEPDEEAAVRDEAWRHEDHLPGDEAAVLELET